MNRRAAVDLLVMIGLVAAGAGTRIFWRDLPNFAPIAAIALFSGFYFRNMGRAACVPLLAMALSDLVIGGYQWHIMATVYAALTLPVVWNGLLHRYLKIEQGRWTETALAFVALLSCSLASSLIFYAATNFACWPGSKIYSQDLAGLQSCMIQGLPFFRYTMAGDLFFGVALFGSYAAAIQLGLASSRSAAIQPQLASEAGK